MCFLVDKKSLQSGNDWKSDDMGSWRNNGVQHFHLGMQGESVFYMDGDDEMQDNVNQYTLKRTYYKNKSSPDLRKIVSFLEGELVNWLTINFLNLLSTFYAHIINLMSIQYIFRPAKPNLYSIYI